MLEEREVKKGEKREVGASGNGLCQGARIVRPAS